MHVVLLCLSAPHFHEHSASGAQGQQRLREQRGGADKLKGQVPMTGRPGGRTVAVFLKLLYCSTSAPRTNQFGRVERGHQARTEVKGTYRADGFAETFCSAPVPLASQAVSLAIHPLSG